MNIEAINKLKNYPNTGSVLIKASTHLLDDNTIIYYPAYQGTKKGLFDFYEEWLLNYILSPEQLKDTMYTILSGVQYPNEMHPLDALAEIMISNTFNKIF